MQRAHAERGCPHLPGDGVRRGGAEFPDDNAPYEVDELRDSDRPDNAADTPLYECNTTASLRSFFLVGLFLASTSFITDAK